MSKNQADSVFQQAIKEFTEAIGKVQFGEVGLNVVLHAGQIRRCDLSLVRKKGSNTSTRNVGGEPCNPSRTS